MDGIADDSFRTQTNTQQTLFLNGGNSKYLRTAHLSTISQVRGRVHIATTNRPTPSILNVPPSASQPASQPATWVGGWEYIATTPPTLSSPPHSPVILNVPFKSRLPNPDAHTPQKQTPHTMSSSHPLPHPPKQTHTHQTTHQNSSSPPSPSPPSAGPGTGCTPSGPKRRCSSCSATWTRRWAPDL